MRSADGTGNQIVNGLGDGLRVGPDIEDSMIDNTNDEFGRDTLTGPLSVHTNGGAGNAGLANTMPA